MVAPAATNRRQQGVTLVELICALSILSILAALAVSGDAAKTRQIHGAYEESLAQQFLASQLEVSLQTPPVPRGEELRELTVGLPERLPHARGGVRWRQIDKGLWELQVEVQWQPSPKSEPIRRQLTTWTVREQTP